MIFRFFILASVIVVLRYFWIFDGFLQGHSSRILNTFGQIFFKIIWIVIFIISKSGWLMYRLFYWFVLTCKSRIIFALYRIPSFYRIPWLIWFPYIFINRFLIWFCNFIWFIYFFRNFRLSRFFFKRLTYDFFLNFTVLWFFLVELLFLHVNRVKSIVIVNSTVGHLYTFSDDFFCIQIYFRLGVWLPGCFTFTHYIPVMLEVQATSLELMQCLR